MSKGGDRIIAQSLNDFSKAAEHLLNKTEVIQISQEKIFLKNTRNYWLEPDKITIIGFG